PGALLGEALVVEAEFGQAADVEILDHAFGARHDLAHDALAFGGLEIELDRALAAVGAVEIGRTEVAAIGCRDKRRAPGAGIVAGTFALNLNDVGAEVGQNLPGPWPRQDAGQLQHTHSGQWTRHRGTPWQRRTAERPGAKPRFCDPRAPACP